MDAIDSAGRPQPMSKQGGYALNLHIDELVLHNVAPGDRYVIAAALEQELTRLFTAEGVPPELAQSGAAARLDGGSFAVAPGATPHAIGVQVARAIHRGMAGAPSAGNGVGQRSGSEPRATGASR
jgi:hypothetical protein